MDDNEAKAGNAERYDCSNCKHATGGMATNNIECSACVGETPNYKNKKPTRWELIETTPGEVKTVFETPYTPSTHTNDTPVIPKPINSTDEFAEIHNHIKSISSLLAGMAAKSRFLRQKQTISLARAKLADFERIDIYEVQKVFE